MRTFILISATACAAFAATALAPAGAGIVKPALHGQSLVQNSIPSRIAKAQRDVFRPQAIPRTFQRAHGKLHLPQGVHKGFRVDPKGSLFVSDDSGYIFQMSVKGTQLVGYVTDCSGAEGVKVDHAGNLWAACTNTSTVNEYAPGSSSATLVLNDTVSGAPYFDADVAFDTAGDVYAANLYSFFCSTSNCAFAPGNVVEWTAPVGPSSVPVVVTDPNISEEAYFLDTDASGNVYVDYDSCISSVCGYGLDQIGPSGPAALIPAGSGTIQYPGGVYIGANGNLNLIDQDLKTLMQYTISPFAPAGFAIGITENVQNTCDPVAGGFNLGDKWLAIGDANCHAVQIGKAKNGSTLTARPNISFSAAIGAAFAPSDK
jgi:hypothetical protein